MRKNAYYEDPLEYCCELEGQPVMPVFYSDRFKRKGLALNVRN
jgi:hypothetical protein